MESEFKVLSESVTGADPGGAVVSQLLDFDKSLLLLVSQSKKLHDRIGRGLKSMKKGVSPKELEKLRDELGNMPLTASLPSVAMLIEGLEVELPKIKKAFATSFNRELKSLCDEVSVSYRQHGEELAIGPCIVAVDTVKERVDVNYAKHAFARLPIHARTVLETISEFRKGTLDRAVDIKKTRSILDEAVRVSLARKSKPAKGNVRIELPVIYREMKFIKEMGTSSKLAEDFSLPRFVVEIAKLLKSDENLDAPNSYSLETAVLENANDPRKSIFFPKDVQAGHGDGTFYQAIVQSL